MAGVLGGTSAGSAMGGASPATAATGAVTSGQYSILPLINKILGIGQPAQAAPPAAATPAAATPGAAQPPAQPKQGFQGFIPMGLQYLQNHQAKMRAAQAQTHLDALQNPAATPEQRQYHQDGLQGLGYTTPASTFAPTTSPAAPLGGQ
jgi:hypothetical protein